MTEPHPKSSKTKGLWIAVIIVAILAFLAWILFGSDRMENEVTPIEQEAEQGEVLPEGSSATIDEGDLQIEPPEDAEVIETDSAVDQPAEGASAQ